MNSIYTLFLSILLFILSSLNYAEAQSRLYFSGFGYEQQFDDISRSLPRVAPLLASGHGVDFTQKLSAAIAGDTSNGMTIVTDVLGDSSVVDGRYGLALVLTDESVHQELTPDGYRILVRIYAQAVVFDVSTSKILWVKPIVVGSIDRKPRAESPAELDQRLLGLLLGQDPHDIIPKFRSAVQTFRFSQSSIRTLQLTSVDFTEFAVESMSSFGVSPDRIVERGFAAKFSQELSENNAVPVLPAVVGHAATNTFRARMSNGDVYQLSIPEADYEIHLTINGFIKQDRGSDERITRTLFATSTDIAFVEPLSGRRFFDEKVRLGITRIIPASYSNNNDWRSFLEVTGELFSEFTDAIESNDVSWAKDHFAEPKNVKQSIAELRELISKCK